MLWHAGPESYSPNKAAFFGGAVRLLRLSIRVATSKVVGGKYQPIDDLKFIQIAGSIQHDRG